MSSCLSGGSRAYRFDLEIVKSPSNSSWTSHSSSPSSTLSESNSPLAISTRKPRTPRKRPNQTYNEAAALLSTAYPNIFSTKHLTKPCSKFTNPHHIFFNESSELLLPFRVIDNSGFLLDHPIQEKPISRIDPRLLNSCDKPCQSAAEIDSHVDSFNFQEDFDAESILDEEIEEGIDSIMGNLSVNNELVDESNVCSTYTDQKNSSISWYGHPLGLGLGFGGEFNSCLGMRRGVRPLRHVDEGEWWRFPPVDVLDISPKLKKVPKEKKKKKVEKPVDVKSSESQPKETSICTDQQAENSIPKLNCGLLLKLNYEEVLNAWSDRALPFPEEIQVHETSGNDLHARLAQIDLFSDGGGLRGASVLRYKEKRRTRLFAKKIRYQVRKVNADQRPRMKGRFVRSPNSPISEQR